MELKVKGHSGCQIDIINDGNQLYICKSTCDPQYVNRLCRQALKQQEAFATKYQHIRIPEIFETNNTGDTFSMKMEYVYSKNFVDYFEDAGFEQINYFIKALEIFVDSEISQSAIQSVSRDIVMCKFADVKQKIQSNPLLQNNMAIRRILEQSESLFTLLPDVLYIPVGTCHGDLTYSNILFNGNNYYLIDFLDSFIESPLLDLVKIRQDSHHGWSQLMYEGEFDKIRLQIINEKIDEAIDTYYSNKYDWFRMYYMPFQVMNLLRVLQYARENEVIDYLIEELSSLL